MKNKEILKQKLLVVEEISHYYNLLGFGMSSVYVSKLLDQPLLYLHAKANNLLTLLREPTCCN